MLLRFYALVKIIVIATQSESTLSKSDALNSRKIIVDFSFNICDVSSNFCLKFQDGSFGAIKMSEKYFAGSSTGCAPEVSMCGCC